MSALPVPEPIIHQDGVLSTAQALRWFSRAYARSQLAAKRWQRPCRGVVVMHNGPLTDAQTRWAALLSCRDGSALCGGTALDVDGITGFAPSDGVQVVMPDGAKRPGNQFVLPHWSTMLDSRDVHPLRIPRRTRPQRSMVDEASWSQHQRRARAVILSGVQKRAVRTSDLRDALSRRGPCRHRSLIVESILDAAGGIQSLPEHDFELIRRRFRLPEPTRQRVLKRPDGKHYLDIDWDAYDASVEIHGIPHMDVLQWDRDLLRANEVTIRGPRALAFSSYAVRHEGDVVGDQTTRLLRRGGWPG